MGDGGFLAFALLPAGRGAEQAAVRRCTGDTDSHSPLSGFPPYKPGIIDAGDGWAGVGGKRRVGAVFLWRTLLVSWSAAEWRWEEVVFERKRKSKSEILKSKSAGGVVRGGGRDGASPRVSSKKRKKKKKKPLGRLPSVPSTGRWFLEAPNRREKSQSKRGRRWRFDRGRAARAWLLEVSAGGRRVWKESKELSSGEDRLVDFQHLHCLWALKSNGTH